MKRMTIITSGLLLLLLCPDNLQGQGLPKDDSLAFEVFKEINRYYKEQETYQIAMQYNYYMSCTGDSLIQQYDGVFAKTGDAYYASQMSQEVLICRQGSVMADHKRQQLFVDTSHRVGQYEELFTEFVAGASGNVVSAEVESLDDGLSLLNVRYGSGRYAQLKIRYEPGDNRVRSMQIIPRGDRGCIEMVLKEQADLPNVTAKMRWNAFIKNEGERNYQPANDYKNYNLTIQ